MNKQPEKDQAYYLTLFRLEGHTRWRAHLGGSKEHFEIEVKNWGDNKPVITEKQVLRIDRLTGTFTQ